MRSLLDPASVAGPRQAAQVAVGLLILSAALIVAATLAMPAGYSWRSHSISESAAQGLAEAWIARLGFLSFGAGVLVLALAMRLHWSRVSYWMNLAFAACMFGTAAFSHKPWIAGVADDPFEDGLHSLTATAMGFAFSIGVVFRFIQRTGTDRVGRVFDVVALAVAIVLPMILASSADIGGIAQRVMFAVAYLWYGREAFVLGRTGRCRS